MSQGDSISTDRFLRRHSSRSSHSRTEWARIMEHSHAQRTLRVHWEPLLDKAVTNKQLTIMSVSCLVLGEYAGFFMDIYIR